MGVKLKAKFFIIFLLLFLCLSIIPTIAQKNDSLEELHKRVESLERERDFWKNNYNDQKERIKEQFDLKSKSLDNKFIELKNKLKDDYNYLKILLLIFGPVTVLGIIFTAYKMWKRVEEIAEEKIREKFDKIFNEKKNQFEKMIENQNEEFQLKEKKSILIISKNEEDESFIEDFFKKMGFKKVEHQSLSKVNKLEKYDLLFLNNEQKNIDSTDILKLKDKTKSNTLFFYFGPNYIDREEFEHRINFSNSRVQLYGNLINSLRYQSLLK